MTKTFKFIGRVQIYPVPAGWHFMVIPKETAEDINFFFAHVIRGWRSLPVIVTIGKTTWKTSIFTDTKLDTFLLPLKAEIRKKEELKEGDNIKISLEITDKV